ncbi:uncharacterized protein K02A2.6-like [Ixodes scapularis]|uniref:uncharacterized protein K02A2.6-like n=1 Tax=Ixodes scapularis TaxID=6945 RepID=UPI001AD6B911|nr:uncharacterized protein K02A2.6-like [Ixodes scapularis]
MAPLGKLDEYDEKQQNFDSYLERFEHFVSANDIKPEKKLAVFLTVIGPRAYEVLKSLVVPAVPGDKSFEEVKVMLKNHYSPKSSVIAERCKFNRRVQEEQESVEDFIVALKHLARKCDFGQFLQDALRDRLVAGIRREETQRALFAEESLTFERACKIALDQEQAARQTALLHAGSKDASLNEIRANQKDNVNKRDVRKHKQSKKSCERCGRAHAASKCWYKNATCHKCGKLGHLQKVCSNEKKGPKNANAVDCSEDDSELDVYHCLNTVRSGYEVKVNVEGADVFMQIDTGAAVTIVPESVAKTVFPHVKCEPSRVNLKTYTGERIPVKGQCDVSVTYENQTLKLPVIVVDNQGKKLPLLMGRNWLERLRLDWKSVMSLEHVTDSHRIEALRNKFPTVFSNQSSVTNNYQAKIVLKQDCTPVFCKARRVPYALRDKVGEELDRLEKSGVLRRVSHSEWATPVVVIHKKDGSLRLCGDYKVTINPVLKTDHYPLPRPEDLYTAIAGGKVFCVLDLSAAYQQVPLAAESKPLLTINTHMGLFQFQRLPFGVASAPAIFQSFMDEVLKGIPHVGCYIDDVIVSGNDTQDCQKTLECVLRRLRDYNVTLKTDKCRFFQSSVTYLGHTVSADGIYPTEAMTKAITEAPEPTCVTELKAYLGMLNFYAKFLKNVSCVAEPLYRLLKKGEKWSWTRKCSEAFAATKQLLVNSQVLTFYDVDKPIALLCDASSYGIGAVIFHVTPEGEERPVAFASRTLTSAEKNYAQCEREALALMFGLKKFHRYLYGREFTLYTDHQPLLGILGHDKPVPTLAAARMQRWAMILAAYRYKLKYRKGKDVEVADALSRLPRPMTTADDPAECLLLFDSTPLTAEDIARATKRDLTLSRVANYVLNGWPAQSSEELKPYHVRRDELSFEQGCVTWGSRVIVPEKLQSQVLALLHEDHPGASRMKMLARSFVWWPGLDLEIESYVRQCRVCQSVQNAAPPVPLQPWSYPTKPWQRVHVDFAAKEGHVFLVLVDSFSKWIEVWSMSSTTTGKTLDKLRSVFAAYGLPEVLVSDNGPQFVSDEFSEFMRVNGIKHVKTPPYHAASNGAAERLVQTTKKTLLKQLLDEKQSGKKHSLLERLDSFLLSYRNTPNSTTGRTPAELFLKRQPRVKLSLLKPDFVKAMQNKQQHLKEQSDASRGANRSFVVGDTVLVKTVRGELVSWEEGVVTQVVSPVTYLVKVAQVVRFTHADHIRDRLASPTSLAAPPTPEEPTLPDVPVPRETQPMVPQVASAAMPADSQAGSQQATRTREQPLPPPSSTSAPVTTPEPCTEAPTSRRSTRVRRPPDRYKPEDFRS